MRVRVELARSSEFPDGSHRHGYEFVLPLDGAGRLDRNAYDRAPELCTVHRFWEGGEDATGEIVHAGGGRWVFSWDPGEGDEESLPYLEQRHVRPGDELAVREANGPERTFCVVLVEPAPGLAHKGPG
jgi:hypothetical protein